MINYFIAIFLLFSLSLTGITTFGNQELSFPNTDSSSFKLSDGFLLSLNSNGIEKERDVSPSTEKNFKFSSRVRFKPFIVKRQDKNDTVFDARMYGKVDWKFSDSLSIYSEGFLLGHHGSIQSVYQREYRKEGFNLLEIFLKYNYNSHIKIKFGSLHQDFLDAPLLVKDKTFPAFQEIVSFSLPWDVTGQLILQQAIPNNMDDDIQYFSQLTNTPFFFTGSLFLETKSHPQLLYSSVEDKLTFFYFTPLPPVIAIIGHRDGNSVSGDGSDAGLKFPFIGIHNNINWQFPFKDSWVVELGLDYLHNFGAPKTYNTGGRIYASLYHDFLELMELKATGEIFGNQSDASVAFYNEWKYGHNNRQGMGLELRGYFYQSGLTVGARYIYNYPIETRRTSLEEGHYFSIYIGTGYISI